MHLDHLAICAADLAEGVAWAEGRLGVPFGAGGQHRRYGTHNRLLGLSEGLYLEVIAIDPTTVPEARPRWFGLDRFDGGPRLANWICRVSDMDAARERLPECGAAVALQRDDLCWEITVPEDGGLPIEGGLPTLLRWQVETPPGASLPHSGVQLLELTVTHPQAGMLADRVALERVRYDVGPVPGLSARFLTPNGEVIL